MKLNKLTFLILSVFIVACQNKIASPEVNLIPKPQSMEILDDVFLLDKNTSASFSKEFSSEAVYLSQLLNFKSEGDKNHLALTYTEGMELEEFELTINPDTLSIEATYPEGIMRGIQTLRQLFPIGFERTESSALLPCLHIHDSPRFPWRGSLLDCCRHFMDKKFVMRYIDLLAYHKMNTLHWHLTEDQGWRIEIKAYPKLTEIGAWRTEKDGSTYGGFYTQDDIREIVAYAARRHITIVPEIELPGHSVAALAGYPEYSCTGGPFEVENDWGVFKDIYCAGNDSTFDFLENVLSEVMELFPSKYIHIGGDEAPKYQWENCDKCQKRMSDEGLHDEHELQSYFIQRIENFLNENDRQLIGWDEILEGGIAESATIQSWRGIEGGIAAAKSGHDAIMSPTSHCYFDYGLDATDLGDVYSFEPVPAELTEEEARHILGGECNMWTERAPQETIDSKVFPRILAMSEVLWSDTTGRSYDEFHQRVQKHYERLDALGVNYGFETVPIHYAVTYENEQFHFEFTKGAKDMDLDYRVDQGEWKSYDGELVFKNSCSIEAKGTRREKPYGEFAINLHHSLSTGKPVSYNNTFSDSYTAGGDKALSNGLKGSENFRDGNWQGFFGEDLEIIIDLGEEKEVKEISTGFYQYNLSWIILPTEVNYEISLDGITFTQVATIKNDTHAKTEGQFYEEFTSTFDGQTAKFVKVTAKNYGTLPEWHPAAGAKAWLFVDEVRVH